MVKRIISSVLFGIGFGFIIMQSLPWVLLLFLAIHIAAQYEYCDLVENLNPALRWGHIILTSIVWLVLALVLAGKIPYTALLLLAPLGIGLVYLPFMLLEYERQGPAEHFLKLQRSILLVTFPLAFVPVMCVWPSDFPVVLLLFGASWMADSGAFFTGKFAGKTLLAPALSPKKTVEGAVGGMLAAGLAWVSAGMIYPRDNHLLFAHAVESTTGYFLVLFLLGGALALVGMFGDLAFSLFKREAKIKNYSALIPGHGGVLDRFDSLIYVAPVLYVVSGCVQL